MVIGFLRLEKIVNIGRQSNYRNQKVFPLPESNTSFSNLNEHILIKRVLTKLCLILFPNGTLKCSLLSFIK